MGRRSIFGGAAAVVVAAAAITMTTSGPANAWLHLGDSTAYPAEGGKWDYGFWDIKVRSYYYHRNSTHGSTVIYDGSTNRSICWAAGTTSSAEIWATNWAGAVDKYYYRIC